MITEDKVIEIFCIMDEFCNNFASECEKNLRLEDKEHPHRNRKGRLSFSEIMTILVCYHFCSFANFKHYYLFYDLVHGLRANMKNRLMPMWDKIMLRKRCIIECINDLIKNKANIVHSRHRSIHNFIMNICTALTAYSFFENKPQALPVHVESSAQLTLF